jgi:hypothetical protein
LAAVKGRDLEDLSIGTNPSFLEVLILRRSRERFSSGSVSKKEGMRRRTADKRTKS